MPLQRKTRQARTAAPATGERRAIRAYEIGRTPAQTHQSPNRKLLVLSLGGLLVHKVHVKDKATVKGHTPDVVNGNFLVFKRPGCTEFLKFCFANFEVGLWSSEREHNIESILNTIADGGINNFSFIWDQEDCIDSTFPCPGKDDETIYVKPLHTLWEKIYDGGKFCASNTLLVDNEPHTALINPANTAIFPPPYKGLDSNDKFLGELQKYLDGLKDARDVPAYVKNHQIGQCPISSSNPNWGYYDKVVKHLHEKHVAPKTLLTN